MPIYVYKCQKCGRVAEEIQKFSDDPLKTCDQLEPRTGELFVEMEGECTGVIERQMTVPAKPHLKGSGWADDGYGNSIPEGQAAQAGGDDTNFAEVAAKSRDMLIKHAAKEFDGAES